MRLVSIFFIGVFVLEGGMLTALLIWSYNITINDLNSRALIFSSTLGAFGSVLVTTGLVYNSFWQHPDLKILELCIDPLDNQLQNIAEVEYKNSIFVRDPNAPGGFYRQERTKPKPMEGFLEVRSTSRASKIRVSIDICNIGITEMSVHEYTVKEKKPADRLLGVYYLRANLPHQKRITLDFNYPEQPTVVLKSGEYEFEIVVISSTDKKARKIRLFVSDDLKIIRWK